MPVDLLSHLCRPYVQPDGECRGRFAPSPSGRMHLGNVYAALMSYVSARSKGGQWLLRIEDIDRQRSRRVWADLIMSDLDWLGLEWDGNPCFQSDRNDIYNEWLARLSEMRLLYPCRCTRAELMASRAPHASDGHVVYSGRCRPEVAHTLCRYEGNTLRLMVPPYPPGVNVAHADYVNIDDRICGHHTVALADAFGDFVIKRRDGGWAYQFAVAVDDALMGITEIVRGNDLLISTAPQRYICSLLGLSAPHTTAHLPLLLNDAGQRLSKRDGALSMEWLRANSSPRDVIVAVCRASGVDPDEMLTLIARL